MANHRISSEQLLKMVNDDGVINTLLMTDEAHFHLSSYVNKQNYCYWAPENPQELHQRPLHSKRLTILSGVGSHLLEFLALTCLKTTKVQPLLWHPSTMWQCYATSVNQRCRRGIDLSSVWFQQDGVTAHTARASMSVLREMFPQYVISRGDDVPWPACSPDLSACDYFLWGYLKSRVFISEPTTIAELKHSIKEEIAAIPEQMTCWVMENLGVRLKQCLRNGGRHLSDVLCKT